MSFQHAEAVVEEGGGLGEAGTHGAAVEEPATLQRIGSYLNRLRNICSRTVTPPPATSTG